MEKDLTLKWPLKSMVEVGMMMMVDDDDVMMMMWWWC
jgi:hypothetical protein